MGHDETHFGPSIRRLPAFTLVALALACGRAESVQSALVNGGGEAGAAPADVSGNPTGNRVSGSTSDGGSGGSLPAATNAASGNTVGSTSAGGSDGGNGGSGGHGGEGGSPSCSPDSRCDGKPSGKSCQGHALTTCEDLDDDGCVDFEQVNCAPGVCLEESSTCSEGRAGEACEDAIEVLHTGFVLSGSDFAGSFGSDLELAEHPECDFGSAEAAEAAEAVFAISLRAGEVLSMHQQGALESIVALKTSCASESPCIDSRTGGRDLVLEHTAAADETVYVIVESFLGASMAADYEIRFDIDSACGNGILEGGEGCDDENQLDGDGCGANCSVEFPFQCSETSPSACSLPPSLGTAGAGEVLSLPGHDPFTQGNTLYYTVTFTERVLVDVLARSVTSPTGDINMYMWRDWGDRAFRGIRTGDEDWPAEPFEPGTYLVELRAATTMPNGFDLTLTTHAVSCGDGELAPTFEACDPGESQQNGCEDCQIAFGWVCSGSPSVCEEMPAIGSPPYSAGALVTHSETEATASYVSHYRLIEFDEDVVLSGTVGPNVPVEGYFGYIAVWDESGAQLYVAYPYDAIGQFGEWFLSAGQYVIELQTFQELASGFTITLETTASDL